MSDSEKELFGDPEDGMEVSDGDSSVEEAEPVHHAALLKRYAPSHVSTQAWISRLPAFLNLEPRHFDAAKYAEVDKSDDQLALEANTVRWKYAAAEKDAEQKVTRVSNARIVEWSDGSRTLQLGNEHFEIKTHQQSEAAFLCEEHKDESLLATRELIASTMSFLPTSTSSATHMMLAKALQRKQENNQIRVGSVNTTEDPDKVQREIERVEQAKEKARRKLAAQRDDIVSYTDRSITPRRTEMEVDEDDEEDDEERVSEEESEAQESDANEDDDEERASRLNQIKRQGSEPAQMARRRVLDDEDSD